MVEENSQRIYNYDLIRIISCICIILIHTTSFFDNYSKNSIVWWIGNIIQNFVRTGLPIFVVLSGALMLNSKEESIGIFYKKRIIKIIIPFFIYNFIYFIFNIYYVIGKFEIEKIFDYIYLIIKGPVYEHFWYIYMILGLYICTPFLKKMCKALNQKELNYLTIIILFTSIIKYLLPSLNINIGITDIVFDGWLSYFLLGYIITNSQFLQKNRKIFSLLGLLSYIITIIDYRSDYINIHNLYTLSITMFLQVIALFLILSTVNLKLNSKKKKFLLIFSKYSFEVYLIHGAIMNIIDRINLKYSIFDNNGLTYNVVFIFMVIVLSYISAFIIHNIIINPINKKIYKQKNNKNSNKSNIINNRKA